MYKWHLWPHMLTMGWTLPYELHKATGISRPACARLLAEHQPALKKLDMTMLLTLAGVFDSLDDPMALLEYRRR